MAKINFTVTETPIDYQQGITHLTQSLDTQRGMVMSSGVEYPGRYSRWDVAMSDPPLEIVAYDRNLTCRALNERGQAWLHIIKPIFANDPTIKIIDQDEQVIQLHVPSSDDLFPEELRSLQPTAVTPLRAVMTAFGSIKESAFGFYGAFGYELIFQFDPIQLAFDRDPGEKLFHVYWVDDVYLVDRRKEIAKRVQLDAQYNKVDTTGLSTQAFTPIKPMSQKWRVGKNIDCNFLDTEYADLVDQARDKFRLGELFEVVLSRQFKVDFEGSGEKLYQKLKRINPSPYEFYLQLGDEQLIGTSPEMFVRINGKRIESCPLSGTIRRGNNAMEEEINIRTLLNSFKDEVELTMCTDVDRNDKARICEPGSVKLLARRSIERYSGLFHTADHVQGTLREDFNGLDGFLSHMWAVTLTGAPKKHAVQVIENLEQHPRRWYGGAVGRISFNGDVNTCITIRTIHIKNAKAHYQAGATLVWDSDPADEAQETLIKSNTFYRALGLKSAVPESKKIRHRIGEGYHALMIDNDDSFVHTLADYFRQCGMTVQTFRAGIDVNDILVVKPDLVIHSPGPGRPEDFDVSQLVQDLAKAGIPQFGVCLGLQGMVEAFGGRLRYLKDPHHGKTWQIMHEGKGMMAHIPLNCQVAAYHSIIADKTFLPDCFEVLAENEQGDVMAIRHKDLPLQAVQFHPESILTMQHEIGLKMIENVIKQLIITRVDIKF